MEMNLEGLTIAEKMLLWGALDDLRKKIEADVKAEVLQLKGTQVAGRVRATYDKGRGSFDYEKIAKAINASDEIIAEFTDDTPTVDWKKVVKKVMVLWDEEKAKKSMAQFWTSGDPFVSLKINKPKKSKQ